MEMFDKLIRTTVKLDGEVEGRTCATRPGGGGERCRRLRPVLWARETNSLRPDASTSSTLFWSASFSSYRAFASARSLRAILLFRTLRGRAALSVGHPSSSSRLQSTKCRSIDPHGIVRAGGPSGFRFSFICLNVSISPKRIVSP